MGIFDFIEKGVVGGLDRVGDLGSKIYHEATGTPTADEKRNQQYAINDQIKAYKDQTELTKQQIDQTRSEADVEKRRVQEKQIRALRRNYRSEGAGLLGVGQSPTNDTASKLGE